MTHVEEVPQQNVPGDGERASVARSAETEWKKDAGLEALAEGYVTLQKQIIEMQTNLQRSIDDAVAERAAGNLPRADLLTKIGRAIMMELSTLHTKKQEMEAGIQDAGGDPTTYTVH